MEGSPCIDAGDPSLPLDPDGSVADIGAYYYPHLVGVDDDAYGSLPSRFQLLQNHPNPFNPITTIGYTLPRRSTVKIDVYNLLGQRVKTLVDQEKPPGSYSVTWNGTDAAGEAVSTGVYFYLLRAGDYVETKKMVLLK